MYLPAGRPVLGAQPLVPKTFFFQVIHFWGRYEWENWSQNLDLMKKNPNPSHLTPALNRSKKEKWQPLLSVTGVTFSWGERPKDSRHFSWRLKSVQRRDENSPCGPEDISAMLSNLFWVVKMPEETRRIRPLGDVHFEAKGGGAI